MEVKQENEAPAEPPHPAGSMLYRVVLAGIGTNEVVALHEHEAWRRFCDTRGIMGSNAARQIVPLRPAVGTDPIVGPPLEQAQATS